jgi:LPXTG-motif cell wall-anchored protein
MRRAVAAMAAGAGIAAAASATAAAGITPLDISGSASWSVATAEPGQTVTLTGGYQNDTAGPASFNIQLNVAGASSDVITSFTNSPTLTGCAESPGNIITCSWNPAAQGDTVTITATVVVPGDAVGQAWQGDASSGNMGLGTDILEIVAPSPTTTTTTTTTTTAAPPAESTTTDAGETTTTAAAAGGGATTTTRPRSAALPATGSSSPGLAIGAAALVLAGGLIVVGARRRHAD